MPKSTRSKMLFKTVCCVAILSMGSGCAAFRDRISGRAWSQRVAVEQEEHENLNETSFFGGN